MVTTASFVLTVGMLVDERFSVAFGNLYPPSKLRNFVTWRFVSVITFFNENWEVF